MNKWQFKLPLVHGQRSHDVENERCVIQFAYKCMESQNETSVRFQFETNMEDIVDVEAIECRDPVLSAQRVRELEGIWLKRVLCTVDRCNFKQIYHDAVNAQGNTFDPEYTNPLTSEEKLTALKLTFLYPAIVTRFSAIMQWNSSELDALADEFQAKVGAKLGIDFSKNHKHPSIECIENMYRLNLHFHTSFLPHFLQPSLSYSRLGMYPSSNIFASDPIVIPDGDSPQAPPIKPETLNPFVAPNILPFQPKFKQHTIRQPTEPIPPELLQWALAPPGKDSYED